MKAKYIVLGLLISLSLSLSARTFLENDQIWVNTDQRFHDSQFLWDNDYAVLWLHVYGSSGSEWIRLNYVSPGLFVANMPHGKNYDHLILVRKDSNKPDASFDDGGVWNRTCRLTIPDHAGFNVLYKFWDGGDGNCDGSAEWHIYTPSINDMKATVSSIAQENIKVCESVAGSQFMLHPKLRSDKKDYDYDNVVRHSWLYSTDKSNWLSLDGYADNANKANGKERNDEFDRDFLTTLPSPIPSGGVYYYLYSSNPAGRRLIHITPNATDCELNCEITAFETAVSDVNADDNTYTLDGMIAFGKADGKLVIECDGKSVTIDAPVSPQTFSLHGVPAATEDGKTTTATAYFEGDQTNCSMTITIKVPNAKEEVEVVNVDSLTGKSFVLTPVDYDPANTYVWLANGDTIKGAPQVLVIEPFGKDSTVTYTYKEYYPPTGSMEDLMENGSYEDATWDYSTEKVSDYDFWGLFPQTTTTQINFYTDTLSGGINYPDKHKDNGFAVVRNANNFYPTYAKVEPKDGNNFALFDAKSGEEGANMKAWYATTANNSKLTLKKGTTYVLSFWAANINSYSEMDNAARFRFYIEDISGMTPVKLDSSELLDLSLPKYRNNLWHQCSKTYTAKADYNNIRISVVNLNNRSFKIGNDFALDDIQFHPISSVSKVVKTQQQFVVTAHEPKIDAFTATVVPLDCDAAPNYTVKMHVEYQNPQGRIIIKDDQSNTYSCVAPSVAFDTKAALDTNIVITGLTPASHTWEAYFEEWPTVKISGVTTNSPVVPTIDTLHIALSEPGCTDLTTTLTFDLAYTCQQGTLTYWVDDLGKQTATYNIAKNTPDTLKVLNFAGIPADGKNNHVLHVRFDGANSCVKEYTLPALPFSPVIDEVAILNAVPAKVTCSTESYEVKVKATTHYEATGKKIVFTYNDNGTKHDTAVVSGQVAEATLVLHNITEPGAPAATQTIYAAFEDHDTCLKGSNSQVTAPQHAAITGGFDVVVSEPDCGDTKYSISGQVEFDMADGDLIIEYDSNHRQVITSPASPASFTINDMDATGDNLTVKAWFSGSAGDACKAESKQFASPVTPQISIETDYVYSPVTCSDETTTLTFKLNYTYQQGMLHYSVDGLAEKTQSITEKDKSSIQTELSFAGIPADGKNNHVLHVRFDGANSCAEDYTLTAVPFSPMIDNVTVTGIPTTVPCGTTAYNATVTITPHYDATGKKIILTYDSLGNRKTTPAIPLTSFPYTITLYNFSAGTHNIYAAYEDTPACTTDNSTGTYTAPVMTSCIRDSITLCENELPYWWPNANDGAGQYYTGTAGENKFGSGTDSLWLFVTAMPQISVGTISTVCDSETEILIPFTVTSGNPDSIDIQIGSNHYEGSIAGSNISFTRTAELAAGDYSATITVGTKGTPCVSETTVHFTIALGNSMYSKWTDVLFISNKDNLFTGYQWYENGMKMEGETSQRLYKPEGLPGAYYCRITTKEGKILTTCEQTFDQVQPSRTDSTEPAKVIRQYRVSPHVYIIQTQTGEEIETKKILTPYE